MTIRPGSAPEPSDKDADSDVKRLDTTPPPPGEDDAYNAPTKVGEVTSEAWAKLIEEHHEKEEELEGPPSLASRPLPPLKPPAPRPSVAPPASTDDIPRLYDEEGEEAPTLLHPSARLPQVGTDAEEQLESLSDDDLRSDTGASSKHVAAAPVSSTPPSPRGPEPTGPLPPPSLPPLRLAPTSTAPGPERPPSRMLTDPIPYTPGKLDFLMRPRSGVDPLPWIIAAAAIVGFVTLTFGILRALGKL